MGIFITCWSHWNYHHLARREPERPTEEITTVSVGLGTFETERLCSSPKFCTTQLNATAAGEGNKFHIRCGVLPMDPEFG